jgi:hypothetical protein
MTALEKRITADLPHYRRDIRADFEALLAAHKACKRELAAIRKLARMSGVDKHWWLVGGVKL